jgi:hypothetical protein
MMSVKVASNLPLVGLTLNTFESEVDGKETACMNVLYDTR